MRLAGRTNFGSFFMALLAASQNFFQSSALKRWGTNASSSLVVVASRPRLCTASFITSPGCLAAISRTASGFSKILASR